MCAVIAPRRLRAEQTSAQIPKQPQSHLMHAAWRRAAPRPPTPRAMVKEYEEVSMKMAEPDADFEALTKKMERLQARAGAGPTVCEMDPCCETGPPLCGLVDLLWSPA